MSDQGFMDEALIEGRKARGQAYPNPAVGCVMVRGGAVIARGHTQPPGQDHAEIHAMRQLAGDLSDVTMYVTLEPCSFHGRTPSCARAIVARGVGRVVVGVLDPDPRNDGRGLDILREGGVEVTLGVLADRARADLGDQADQIEAPPPR